MTYVCLVGSGIGPGPGRGVGFVSSFKKAVKAAAQLPAKLVNGALNFLAAAFCEGYAFPKEA
jgi:hypothetical protein